MSAGTPYISVVVAARNDDHGGNMLGRMQAFLDSWIQQAQRYQLPSEIVVVEWNPPSSRPRLQEALRLPADAGICPVRFVEVSEAIHQSIPNAVAIPLHQMIAKNVGIRRARGEYILVSNLDIIFSPELMQYFAARKLEAGVLYRIDRWDIASDIPATRDVDELLRFCRANILRMFAREGHWDGTGDRTRPVEPGDILSADSGIRFGYGWYGLEAYDDIHMRYPEEEAEILFDRPANAPPRMIFDAEVGPSAIDGWVKIEIMDETRNVLASAYVTGRVKLRLSIPPELKSGRFWLRILNGGVPVMKEPRMLNVRFLRISWANTVTASGSGRESQEGAITKEFKLDVTPDKGYAIDTLDVVVTDPEGNVVSFAAEASELDVFAKSPEYRVNLMVRLRPEGEAERFNPGRVVSDSPNRPRWRLEVVARIPGVNWRKLRQTQNPHAKLIRRAANLHTSACGDFTLMARENWFQLRAYPEFPIWPMHVDSILCYSAYHAGVREEILKVPMQIFHVQHLNAAGWTPEGQAELDARVARKKVPTIQYEEMLDYVDQMRRFDTPLIFSPANWGLADLNLPEFVA